MKYDSPKMHFVIQNSKKKIPHFTTPAILLKLLDFLNVNKDGYHVQLLLFVINVSVYILILKI